MRRLRRALSYAYWRLRETAIHLSPTRIFFRVAGSIYDWRHGIRTSGIVPVDELQSSGANAAHARRYNPSLLGFTGYVLRRLRIAYREFSFVDIGSGKGRVLLEASSFAFRRIIGVEFSPMLHREAEQSIRRFQERTGRGANIELLCMDAADFPIPDGNAVLYFYNPFDREVMTRVLGNIEAALLHSSRVIEVVYLNPVDADLFDASAAFSFSQSGRFADQAYRVYASNSCTRSGSS